MADRSQDVQSFLAYAGWADAERCPVAGDMSSRRYWRLILSGRSAILMDADSPMTAFARMTKWLVRLGLSAPRILASRADAGLLLLEDFGDVSLKDALLGQPEIQDDVYKSCVELLMQIRAARPPALPRPTATELTEWTRLAEDHYPGAASAGLVAFRTTLSEALTEVLEFEASVSLRDYHTENMMWLPERHGYEKLGLLDYQDAFLTHPAYDLVSLLTDARNWVPKSLREEVIDLYLALSDDNPEDFRRAFAVLSAQRNMRILGVFARAQRHLACLPNTYRYLAEALDHPVFARVRVETLSALPAPENAT